MLVNIAAVSLAITAIVLPFRPDRAMRVATGLISHTLCSETFIAGLDPDKVYAEHLKPIHGIRQISWAIHYKVDRDRKEVTATIAGGFKNRAVYREGLGCVVVHEGEPEPVSPQETLASVSTVAPAWPDLAGPQVVEPTDEKLRAALEHAFAEPPGNPWRQTKAVVIAHDGHIIAERYAPGYGIDTPLISYSLAKSVTNAQLGILVREGRLAMDKPAPVAEWSKPGDPRGRITLDNLLSMTSGLALDETGSGFDRNTRMLYLERDMARYAECAHLKRPPGTKWEYASGNTIIISRIIRDTLGGHAADVSRFARQELFAPLGMRNVTMEFDSTGTQIGSTYVYAPARDWVRLGLLYLNDGVVNGRRILPEGWVHYSSSPTLGNGYGAGFWTNIGPGKDAQDRVRWGMPPDSFFASGTLGQFIVVVPSERLVVARFGVTQDWPFFDVKGVAHLVSEVTAALKTEALARTGATIAAVKPRNKPNAANAALR
jgi:CubicO group peptidase (beta-lactamase class C family)